MPTASLPEYMHGGALTRAEQSFPQSPMPAGHALIRLQDVETLVGLKHSFIYALIRRRTFPRPVKIGTASRWLRAEVDDWVSAQLNKRDSADSRAA